MIGGIIGGVAGGVLGGIFGGGSKDQQVMNMLLENGAIFLGQQAMNLIGELVMPDALGGDEGA